MNISGRSALVTGASGGLGQEIARVLAAHGASVVLSARRRQGVGEVRVQMAAARRERARPR